MKFSCLLTPVMASKNDARHGVDYSVQALLDAMPSIVFDAISGIKKLLNFHAAINFPT